LIHKVNRPSHLTLISSKRTENDPGSSQGSGLFYDGGGQNSPHSDQKDHSPPTAEVPTPSSEKPTLHTVSEIEQTGMTDVVKDLLELRKGNEPSEHNRPGLAVKYTSDASPAKGLLLNRKAE
jgi:hypothetical protein